MEIKTQAFPLLIAQILTIFMVTAHGRQCRIFNFGDSNTDTGAMCAIYGEIHANTNFFVLPGHEVTCMASDGRLYIDFLCESLGMETLSPYLEPVGSDFSNGVNFAISGAKILHGITISNLGNQKFQFGHFRNRALKLLPKGKGPQITPTEFEEAIYSMDIGQNDLASVVNNNSEVVFAFVTPLLQEIETTIKALYRHGGARKFVIYNTVPLGCLPGLRGDGMKQGKRLDAAGCVEEYIQVSVTFNEGLYALCAQLRNEMKDALIVHMDMYTIKYDLFVNSFKYGFGINPFVPCISNGTCDPSRSLMWDGYHFTEAANRIIAAYVSSQDHAFPKIKFGDLCTM